METPTPMLKQYQRIKNDHRDCILFFRLGDFYEMFYEDAKVASGVLDVVLTSRGSNKSGKVPMCGIPYHAAETYITRLIRAGLKVAICEQIQDPALAKGIVEREVVRVITSGTFIDNNTYEPRYLLSVSVNKRSAGIAFADPASGTIYTNELTGNHNIIGAIARLPVCECIFPDDEEDTLKFLGN